MNWKYFIPVVMVIHGLVGCSNTETRSASNELPEGQMARVSEGVSSTEPTMPQADAAETEFERQQMLSESQEGFGMPSTEGEPAANAEGEARAKISSEGDRQRQEPNEDLSTEGLSQEEIDSEEEIPSEKTTSQGLPADEMTSDEVDDPASEGMPFEGERPTDQQTWSE